MAGTIIVSSIKTDTDNSFIVRSNTGATLFSVDTTSISIPDGSITSAMIANGTVIAADILDGTITAAKLAPGAALPSQTSNATYYLTSDGTNAIWKAQTALAVANTQLTGSIEATQVGTTVSQLFGTRNRIINGDMRIDQRNAGAAVTLTASAPYTVDRWLGIENTDGGMTAQQDSSAPPGFNNSLKLTTTSADSSLSASQNSRVQQHIEGYNVADLGWGTANAKTVTLSFWVRSSLTGTFAGGLRNYDANRGYPFNYTISAANTWEYKTVTVAGDTSGTWDKTNSGGLAVIFDLGSGSDYQSTVNTWGAGNYFSTSGATSVIGNNGATWYITGVQLEVGTSATPFERRLFNQELTACQRYYIQSYPYGTVAGTNIGSSGAGALCAVNYGATSFGYTLIGPFSFPVTMRTSAAVTVYNSVTGSTSAASCIRNVNASTNVAGIVLSASDKQVYISCDNAAVSIRAECAITASAEL